MRRFLNNLFRDFRTTSTSRGGRRAPRRATLQVEGLEDRLVMTSASGLGSSLLVNASPAVASVAHTQPIVNFTTIKIGPYNQPTTSESLSFGQAGTIYIRSDGAGNTDVFGPTQTFQFRTSTVNSVSIFVQSASAVVIDDSNGMPFAPGTAISLDSSTQGVLNGSSVYLEGSQTVAGNETYVAGGMPGTPGTISLAGVTFTLHIGILGVHDSLPITGALDVQTSGTQVQLLSNGPGGQQYLNGMGLGGGDFLGYSNKPAVCLETYAPSASIFLDAPDAAVGESSFTVNMHAAGETTTIDETPKNVITDVGALPSATNAIVSLWGNFGPVNIAGNSSTGVSVGYPLNSTGTVTRGIEANVSVNGASYLVVNDHGNVSTSENVTVTDSTIYGSGLFGNSDVMLEYFRIPTLDILTGQLSDGYTVEPSSPNAVFTSSITIDSSSHVAFHVNVSVYSASHLNLTLFDRNPRDGSVLDVRALGFLGFVNLPGTFPNGTIDLFTNAISYNGFYKVS